MEYQSCIPATFQRREKRFTAYCTLKSGEKVTAHVRNTGRCAELLYPGVEVFLEYTPSPTRKNDYTLYMVNRGDRLINIDSQSPNKLGLEGIQEKKILLPDFSPMPTFYKPEHTFGNSRFDLYVENGEQSAFIEFKGVTLEENNVVYFPDAPSLRAQKHVDEMVEVTKAEKLAYIIFIIQMGGDIDYFTINTKTQPLLKEHLLTAKKAGVHLLAYDTKISGAQITVQQEIPICLEGEEE